MRLKWLVIGLACTVAVLASGTELYARYELGLGDPPLTIRDSEIDYLFKPGTYHRFGNTIHYNEWSMRADDVNPTKTDPSELRVLVLGDSVVNGGALTDDSELATHLAQGELSERLGRPVWVGNVSAGSWGPGNLLAYTDRYGWFDADIAVIVLSSHDLGDVPDFQSELGEDFPMEAPILASWEAVTRYLPRYLPPSLLSVEADEGTPPPDRETQLLEGRKLLARLLESAGAHVPAVVVLHHPEMSELAGDRDDGTMGREASASIIAVTTAESGATFQQLGPYLHRAPDGQDPYRDAIHINVLGQRLYADAIICVVERAEGLDGETCA